MARTPKSPPESIPAVTEPDAPDAEAAFRHWQARIEAVSDADIKPLRFDLRAAATEGIAVARRANDPQRRPRFENLAQAREFDLARLDGLAELSRAAWYVRHRVTQLAAVSTEVQVPELLVTEGARLKARMMKVLEFHFDDHDKVGPVLAHIRRGTGYQDLADDLTGLAALYKEHDAVIAGTPKYYFATDGAAASRLASRIINELGGGQTGAEHARWVKLQDRVATLLADHYEEVQSAGSFLFRRHAEVDKWFPSLYVVARGGGRARDPGRSDGNGGPGNPGSAPSGPAGTPA